MSIERTNSFRTSDGKVFEDLDKAKTHELALMFTEKIADAMTRENCLDTYEDLAEELGGVIVGALEKVEDILSTTERSIAKARAINGGKKPRKKAEAEAPAYDRQNGNPLLT